MTRCQRDGFALVSAGALLGAENDPFLGMTIGGRFVIHARIGAGSMGTVYCARQEAMGRDVAIKILRSDRAFDVLAKTRFAREARAMSLLSSPHTATVFDFGEIPDDATDLAHGSGASLYLAMELLGGESLGARLKRLGRLPVDEAVHIAKQALLSLAEAHEKGVIHRDLKPDNLFLSPVVEPAKGEICKVLDFGIAKIQSKHTGVDALETQAGTVFGTPRYMSPEQAQGKPLDGRSDLYALGVLLYHMLVGRPPFVDDDAVVVMARHIKSKPLPPHDALPHGDIGPALSRVIMRTLAKDPAQRPASATDLIRLLDRAMRERETALRAEAAKRHPVTGSGEMAAVSDGLASPATSRPSSAGERAGRRRGVAIVSVIAAVVVTFGLTLRPAARPVQSLRASLGFQVNARRLALLRAETAASALRRAAPEAVNPAAVERALAPAAPQPSGSAKVATPARPRRRYRRFE